VPAEKYETWLWNGRCRTATIVIHHTTAKSRTASPVTVGAVPLNHRPSQAVGKLSKTDSQGSGICSKLRCA
jgi:hypothetical protein